MSILTQVALRKLANVASTGTDQNTPKPNPARGTLLGAAYGFAIGGDPRFNQYLRNRHLRQQMANYQPTKRGSLREAGQTLRNLPGTLANNVGNGLKSAANWVTSGYQNMKNR